MFFEKLWEIKEKLEGMEYKVLLPSMKDYSNTYREMGEIKFAKIHYNLIKDHFKKIDESDAVLVCNFDRDGIEGCIGGNSFLEMGKAFDKGIPIFLLKPVPKMFYRDEILAIQPIELKNLEEIEQYSEKWKQIF